MAIRSVSIHDDGHNKQSVRVYIVVTETDPVTPGKEPDTLFSVAMVVVHKLSIAEERGKNGQLRGGSKEDIHKQSA